MMIIIELHYMFPNKQTKTNKKFAQKFDSLVILMMILDLMHKVNTCHIIYYFII